MVEAAQFGLGTLFGLMGLGYLWASRTPDVRFQAGMGTEYWRDALRAHRTSFRLGLVLGLLGAGFVLGWLAAAVGLSGSAALALSPAVLVQAFGTLLWCLGMAVHGRRHQLRIEQLLASTGGFIPALPRTPEDAALRDEANRLVNGVQA